jgi:hypothetical protein
LMVVVCPSPTKATLPRMRAASSAWLRAVGLAD